MAFSKPPRISKRRINRAGEILTTLAPFSPEWNSALRLADQWRACHAYPINTFQATLRTRIATYPGNPIVAQRLKRMPTIIGKLKRYPAMKLTTMQDIAGVRAILDSTKDVYRLASKYRDNIRFKHELVDQKDYIENPRSEDGYRSVHLIYKYRNNHASEYNSLRIEIQIRTKLQHIWATAVETMGTFLGQALKSRQGDQEWLDFFALVSSAFALKEGCTPIPRYAHLSKKNTMEEINRSEISLGALNMMRGLSVAASAIHKTSPHGKGWSYHLIILNSIEKTVQIKAYNRANLGKAIADYGRVEAEAAKGAKIEPVLVSAGPIDKLRRAYPNFFLDVGVFARIVGNMCRKAQN